MTLEAKNLPFHYSRQRGGPVLEGVNFVLKSGERLGLSAPSGRGKTTLCKLLAGWERPVRGEVLLDSAPLPGQRFCPVQLLWQHPEEAVDPLLKLRRTLGEAGTTDPGLLEGLGVREDWLERYPSELSGGELQRICIARALRPELRFLLRQAEERSLGLLIASHDRALLERLCTRIISWEELSAYSV